MGQQSQLLRLVASKLGLAPCPERKLPMTGWFCWFDFAKFVEWVKLRWMWNVRERVLGLWNVSSSSVSRINCFYFHSLRRKAVGDSWKMCVSHTKHAVLYLHHRVFWIQRGSQLIAHVYNFWFSADPEPMGLIEWFVTVGSIVLLIITFPISLCASFKVVQEYERAVIFRLGRLRKGGPRGPGIFFVLPCIDTYCKVDLRTVSFDVPPQEVRVYLNFHHA